MMMEQEKLKVNIEGPKEEVKAILRALAYYDTQPIEFPTTSVEKTCEGDCNCKTEAPKTEKKTRNKKEKEVPVAQEVPAEELKPPFPSESTSLEAPAQEVTETPEPPKMPEVKTDLEPAKELEPAPVAELAKEISQEMVLEELKGYCIRMQHKYPQKSQDDIKGMSRAMCFAVGGSETGIKGVPSDKLQDVLEAAQSNWEPDADDFGEL